MNPEQLALYRRLLDDSVSARAEKDPEQYIFLRGWNAALQHASEMLDKALAAAPAPKHGEETPCPS